MWKKNKIKQAFAQRMGSCKSLNMENAYEKNETNTSGEKSNYLSFAGNSIAVVFLFMANHIKLFLFDDGYDVKWDKSSKLQFCRVL